MKHRWILSAVFLLSACAARDARFEAAFPLPVPEGRSMLERWAAKPVLDSLLLDDMEGPMRWRVLEGTPRIRLVPAPARDGRQVLRLESSLRDTVHMAGNRTPWGSFKGEQGGYNGISLDFAQPQDWSAYNRLSLWVYIHPTDTKVVPLALLIRNEGTQDDVRTPSRETDFDLVPGQWQQLLWEIDYYPRERITQVEIGQTLIGCESGAGEVTIDLDRLELQKVTPDHYEGWEIPRGEIATAHTGYRPRDPKRALARALEEPAFSLLDENGREVFSAPVQRVSNKGIDFALLDFSRFSTPGTYTLRYGDARSHPFPIGRDVWLDPLFSALNFFYCQRCGYPVEGIHGTCHQDTQGFHDGRTCPANGGWHDAGDLSQGWWRSGMSVYAWLRALDVTEGTLHRRIAEEAAWGLDYLQRVRFGDGYHVTWTMNRIYSDNQAGTLDDVRVPAQFIPWENYLGVAAFLEAAAREDFRARKESLEAAAREDWEATIKAGRWTGLSLEELSWGATASALMYARFAEPEQREAALRYAALLLERLQQAPPRYYHSAFEEAPMLALRQLARVFPEEAAPWKEAARRYLDGFIKPGSRLAAPYDLLPMGIDRTFPRWMEHIFHGSTIVDLSFAWAVAEASALLDDGEGMYLVQEQLEWTLGRNPFGSSLMYGVGYNYAPNFVYCTHHSVGAIPVGVDSFHEDQPFWNGTANACSHEVWVEPANRFVGALATFLFKNK